MLLGQIVAISFATNLFMLTLLLSPPAPAPSSYGSRRQAWLGPWLLNLFAIFATAYPAMQLADEHYWHHPTHFMPVLMAPHIALMLLPVARAVVPASFFIEDIQFTDKVYSYMWALVLGNAGLMLAWTTATAYAYGGFVGIQSALLEHPAVSSVGFDVIFCWITWACWYWTQPKPAYEGVSRDSAERRSAHADDEPATALGASGYDGGARHR